MEYFLFPISSCVWYARNYETGERRERDGRETRERREREGRERGERRERDERETGERRERDGRETGERGERDVQDDQGKRGEERRGRTCVTLTRVKAMAPIAA